MSKNPNSPSTGHASNPSAIPAPMQPPRSLPKQNKVWSRFTRRIQAIPLSTKLVTCIIVLLTIGTIGISFSIRTLVGNYLLQKTDTQLINQAQLIFNSMDSLSSDTGDDGRSLMNTYYVEVRDSEYKSTGAGSVPMLRDGVVSEPSLPACAAVWVTAASWIGRKYQARASRLSSKIGIPSWRSSSEAGVRPSSALRICASCARESGASASNVSPSKPMTQPFPAAKLISAVSHPALSDGQTAAAASCVVSRFSAQASSGPVTVCSGWNRPSGCKFITSVRHTSAAAPCAQCSGGTLRNGF